MRIVAVSGHVAAGKSDLAARLAERFGFRLLKTREVIAQRRVVLAARRELQGAGEALDRETDGRWVAESVAALLEENEEVEDLVVDAVRIPAQVHALRRAYNAAVVHVHLTAELATLEARWKARPAHVAETKTYADVLADPTEAEVERLQEIADIVIRTDRQTREDVVVRVASRLGLYGREVEPLVDVLVGGQYGSEGKGQVAAHLAPEYGVLVRVGGPNAGHQVWEEPEPMKFHHLPSGSWRAPHAKVVLGPGAVIRVEKLQQEIQMCELRPDRLSIDPQAMIIEDRDRAWEEEHLTKTIGSTGQGVGRATARKVLRHPPDEPVRLAKDEPLLAPYVRSSREIFDEAYRTRTRIMIEGTQGTALSLHHGWYPYVTSRDTTVSGCLAESGIPPNRVRRIVMVCRTYPIRVESPPGSTSGPMSMELDWSEISKRSGIPLDELQKNEKTTSTGRKRRVGEFEWELLRLATSLNGPTDIALTFVDYLNKKNQEARRYEQLDDATISFIEEVERVARTPVSMISVRFAFRSIIDRRTW
jgi:adenylosuccinate synthase